MKTPLFFALLIFSSAGLCAQQSTTAANALRLDSRDSVNAFLTSRYLVPPPSSGSAFVVFDGPSIIPRFAVFDPVFTYTGGTPNAPISIDFTGLNLSDYGLGDVVLDSDMAAAMATKMDLPSGATSQYIRGDGSIVAFPSIPAAQVNADWTAASGVAQILNKPTLSLVATSGAYSDLSGLPALGTAAATNASAYATAAQGTLATTALQPGTAQSNILNLTTDLAGKFNNPSGTTLQYLRGNGSLATFPTDLSAFSNGPGYLTSITSGQITTALGFTPYNASNPSAYVNQAGARTAISLTTTGTSGAATYNNSTGVFNIPQYAATLPTFNNSVVRGLNSNYTISASQNARVVYSINVAWSVTALLSSTSSAFLEYSTNGGAAWNTVSQVSRNIGALTLGLSGNDDLNVSGEIPANALVRIRTVATNSTVSYVRGQEVLT